MRSYRSLVAWQQAHELCVSALRTLDSHNHPRTFALFDQLRRAVISVEANIVEGYALQTSRQFRRHLRIAIGSAAEVECLLNLATELAMLPEQQTADLRRRVDRVIALLFGLLRKTG
jgi:four helix bundle protein